MNRLLLIDFSALAYRAYFDVAPHGTPSPAGDRPWLAERALQIIAELIERERPTHLAFACDTDVPTFRHQLYPAYKSGREAKPADFVAQRDWALAIVRELGFATYAVPGYEADDVIAALVSTAPERFARIAIAGSDRDLAALIDQRTVALLCSPRQPDYVEWDIDACLAHFGVAPLQLPEWKALAGDSSDNYAGCPGIGEKGATKLLIEHGNLARLLEAAEDMNDKTGRLLRDGHVSIELAWQLASLRRDTPLAWDPADTVLPDLDPLYARLAA